LAGVSGVQIYHFPLGVKLGGYTGRVLMVLVNMHVWEAEKITLVVALRVCFLDRVYFFDVMSIMEPFGSNGFSFSGSYDFFGIPYIVFVCISIYYNVIPV
jgi:hypothetical protein